MNTKRLTIAGLIVVALVTLIIVNANNDAEPAVYQDDAKLGGNHRM